MKYYFIFFIIFASNLAQAISETNYESEMRQQVLPYLQKSLKFSKFSSYDGLEISYGILQNPNSKGTVVISPGRTESIFSYREWIYDLSQKGYSVAIIDHRGQGSSSRLVPGSDVGHVEKFSDYVQDFQNFLEKRIFKEIQGPYYLMAVSMGSTIASLYMADHPGKFRSAVFVAPMIQINLQPLPEFLAMGLARFLSWIGLSNSYAPSTGPFDLKRPFKGNIFTSSETRYAFEMKELAQNVTGIVGGSSVAWVRESLFATSQMRARAKDIRDPILIFQAGNDLLVDSDAQKNFCKDAVACQLVVIPEAMHCLQIEADTARQAVLNKTVLQFSL